MSAKIECKYFRLYYKYFRWWKNWSIEKLHFASDRLLDELFIGMIVKVRVGWFRWDLCEILDVSRLDCGIFNILVKWEDESTSWEPSFRFFSYLKGEYE